MWLRRLLGLALAATLAPACVHAPPHLTPEAKASFQIRRVLVAIGALQSFAIDGEEAGIVPRNDARAIVRATVTCAAYAESLNVALEAGSTEADARGKALAVIRETLKALPGHLSPKTAELAGPYIDGILAILLLYGH